MRDCCDLVHYGEVQLIFYLVRSYRCKMNLDVIDMNGVAN